MSEFTIANPRAIIVNRRAIAVDMSSVIQDQTLFRDKHMTLFFRPSGFNEQDLAAVNSVLNTNLFEEHAVKFTLTPWGQRSDLVKGELEALGMTVRSKFPQWLTSKDRPLHIQMR